MDTYDSTIRILMFVVVVAAFIGIMIFRVIKYGGFKASFYGASIKRTLGEITIKGFNGRITLRVHSLDASPPSNTVAMDFVTKSINNRMMPLTMSRDEARQLASLLEAAAGAV